MRTLICCFIGLIVTLPATGADAVFETAVKLNVPRSKKDKRADGPADQAIFRLWIPDGVKTLRGVTYNAFYLDHVRQQHWQEAARHWGFGILAGNQFGVAKTEQGRTVVAALEQLGREAKHPELANVPLFPAGMSAGAGMAVEFTAQAPERVLAAGPVCLEVGPRNDASMAIPIITIFGEKDGQQLAKLAERLPEARAQQGQFATAVQWSRKHEFGRANNLLFVLFDRALAHRYPADTDPARGPIKLNRCELASGWLGDPATWDQPVPVIAPYDKYQGDKSKACWFPDAEVAHAWQAFVVKSPVLKIAEPAGLGDGQPFAVLPAEQPIRVAVKLAKDLNVKKLELFAGSKPIGVFEKDVAEVKLPAGIHALIAVATLEDGSRRLSWPNTVVVAKR